MAKKILIIFVISLICKKSESVKENLTNPTETSDSQSEMNTGNRYVVEAFLTKYSLVYGLTVALSNNNLSNLNVNPECVNNMKLIKHAIDNREIWAIKLFDSSGTFGSDFILGNNFWLGSRNGCHALNEKLSITLLNRSDRKMIKTLLDEVSPIEVKFRMLHIKHNSPWQLQIKWLRKDILHVGLCVPSSCSNNEIGNISQHIFNQNTLQMEYIYEFHPEVTNVRSLELNTNFFNQITVKIFIFIVMVTVILSIYAGCSPTDESNQRFTFQRVVKCFSVKHNYCNVVSMEVTPNSIPVINGLRSIMCFWIVGCHINPFMFNTIDNTALFFHYIETFKVQVIGNLPMLVDIFFTISGFLLADNFLQNKNQIIVIQANSFYKNLKLFGRKLIQRYLRLTPLCILTSLTMAIVTAYLADVSYFYINERNDLLFNKYWWRTLLYIQNLFHADDMPSNWIWSLACEMQYFIFFTIILFVYAKNPRIATKIFFLSWFIFFITTLSIALYKQYSFDWEPWYETMSLLYFGPWARIQPYYIGVLAAYFLNRNDRKMFINEKYLSYISIGSAAMTLIILHVTVLRDYNFIFSSIALVVGRLLLGIPVIWVIITSITGHRNWFTTFLEHRRFVHINKVSYAIYLLNPIIIVIIAASRDTPMHIDAITMFFIAIPIIIIIYILSIPLTILFEIPYTRLSDEFVRIQRGKQSTKDT